MRIVIMNHIFIWMVYFVAKFIILMILVYVQEKYPQAEIVTDMPEDLFTGYRLV